MRYPIDLVVRYLQHAHHVFLNHKLPYMASLVENLTVETIGNAAIIRDLQTFFPLFIDEFIEHIHEEEDTFFKYILLLHQASHGKFKQGELYQAMEKNPVHFFALEHHIHDDEMRGIREITNDYTLDAKATLHLVVLYEEFKSFERDLKLHARIEDCVLLPKAIRLEKLVKAMLHPKVKLN
ncbi:MAG TPA: iron-sulfur cluster repair di-iron protein [Microscillaceae bacterium]|nr:iron-sulfur cluster repair di-iron protein [Microscillaceae bacterium]